MKKAYIFVDNLRIGGYQRLSLDQAYVLSDFGFSVRIIALEPKSQWIAANIDQTLILEKGVEILEVSSNHKSLLIFMIRTFASEIDSPLIISHSLRSTFALRMAKQILRKKLIVNTTLHQLPRLSHFNQRLKRFCYAQFTDNLFCFSRAAELSWISQFGKGFPETLVRKSKKIQLLRNGIYLDRLPKIGNPVKPNFRPRIIFLGRLSFWKGLNTVKNLARSSNLSDFDFLLMVPTITPEDLTELTSILGERLTLIEGKSIASLVPHPGDVHIYPADYGHQVEIIESVSLNCLEMCAIGIPSVVSQGGLLTWPELYLFELFEEVDWSNLGEVEIAIKTLSGRDMSMKKHEEVRELISIENQIQKLIAHLP